MDTRVLKNFLKQVDIFATLSDEGLMLISGFMSETNVSSGEVVFNEGEPGRELYIVCEGGFSMSIALADGGSREVARFEEGDFFGEMSIFEKAPRSATCTALENSRLIIMKDEDFFRIIEESPENAIQVIYRMMHIIARRLKKTSSFLTDMVHWGESARKRAITDEFTGAYNRRFLEDSLEGLFEEARRTGSPLSVAMVDFDYFRQINDEYGHEAGDQLILEVVKAFNIHLSETDMLARYGGDEFTLIMPGRSMDNARSLCEKIRCEVERITLLADLGGSVRNVSISQGIATYPECASTLKELKEGADKGLYLAKERGRNRIDGPGDILKG